MNSLVRIKKEYKDIRDSKDNSIHAELVADNFTHWKGYITGPDNTPYAGGHFTVDIHIPANYPFEPPKMKFDTKIWHPNISSQTGAICLDILKNEWSPALTLRTAMLSLQALLSTPNPDDPQDAQVAGQFKRDYAGWERTAREWTQLYAVKKQGNPEILKKLTDMGFDEKKCREALDKNNWDEAAATEHLLTHS